MKACSSYRRSFEQDLTIPVDDEECRRIVRQAIVDYGNRNYARSVKIRYPGVYSYVSKRFDKLNGHPQAEKFFWLINGIYDFPTCPICGKQIKAFLNSSVGYSPTCSTSCGNKYRLMRITTEPRFELTPENDEMFRRRISCLKLDFSRPQYIQELIAREHDIVNYVFFRYPALKGHHLAEKMFWFVHDLKDFPKCPVCGKTTAFRNSAIGYSVHCSEHVQIDSNVAEKKRQTFRKHSEADPDFLTKRKQKSKATKRAKGKDENWNNTEKACETRRENHDGKFWTDEMTFKTRATLKDRYGSETWNNTDLHKKTCLELYGEESYSKTEEYRRLYQDERFLEKRNARMNESKLRNGTFNTSKPEDRAYAALILAFGKEYVERQHRDEIYPFCCDFYIRHLDLYIECNFHWTHGGHWFDKNNTEDIALLKKWREAGERTRTKNPDRNNMYEAAIRTWTERDPLKLRTAENARLNYLVFWTEKELEEWLDIQSKQQI